MSSAKIIPNENSENTLDPQEKKICIVQITRTGDLIQTIQAVMPVKKARPEIKFSIIARKKFADPIMFLLREVFDEVHLLDLQSMYQQSENKNIEELTSKLRKFVSSVEASGNINVLVNQSYSKSSSYLMSLIKSNHKLGPYYDDKASIMIHDKWSQFVYSNVMGGPLNPFALVDIYRKVLGHIPGQQTDEETVKEVKNVLIHPFASHAKKMWKTTKWVEVIYKFLRDNQDISVGICGGKEDLEKARELLNNPLLQAYSNRITSYVGNTNIEELYKKMDDYQLFVGHDSLVGNIASLKKIKTITVSLGTVRPSETTPYGKGNYNLSPETKCFPCFPTDECAYYQCHADIPYQALCSVMQEVVQNGKISDEYISGEESAFHFSSSSVHQATINDFDQLRLDTVIGKTHSNIREVFRTFYRVTWQYFLDEQEENLPIPKINDITYEHMLMSIKGLEHLFELTEFGKKYSQYILEEVSSKVPDVIKIKEFSNKLDEIDRLMISLKTNFQYLSPIIDFFAVAKGSMPGGNIVELSEQSFLNFHNCALVTSIMYELCEKTIAPFQQEKTPPVAQNEAK